MAEAAAERVIARISENPGRLAICLTGVVSHANNVEDAWLMLGFGALGWLMKRYDWSAAPMILGLVLGPIFENSLRQSLTKGVQAKLARWSK